jgi:hypothetical protein
MKKIIFTLLLSIYLGTGTLVFAQFNQSSPQTFQTYLSNGGYCPNLNYKGSIHYDTQSNKLVFCTGANTIQSGSSVWANATGGISYSSGNIGIGLTSPSYDLTMGNGTTARFANNLLITNKLGINTNTPSEKLELNNTFFQIFSSTDIVFWNIRHVVGNSAFGIDCSLAGSSKLYVKSGNVGIGGIISPTSKLDVLGSGSFAGNVTSAGKGLLQNSTSAQLNYFEFGANIVNNFTISGNSCSTVDFPIPLSYLFTSPPAVAFSYKYSDGLTDDRIIISIEGVTTTTVTLRFCNTSSTSRTISANEGYRLVCFGEGN